MTRNRAFRVVNGAFPVRKVMVSVQNEDKMNGGMGVTQRWVRME